MSVVYFMRYAEDGPIKVGTTARPVEVRRKALDTGPEAVSLIGYIAGGVELEQRIHRALKPWRKRNEWFRPTEEVEGFVRLALDQPEAIEGRIDSLIGQNEDHFALVERDGALLFAAICFAVQQICKRETGTAVAAVIGKSADQIRKYKTGDSVMAVTTLGKFLANWPDDFALFYLLSGLWEADEDEVRANRSALEDLRDAIEVRLAKLRPQETRA